MRCAAYTFLTASQTQKLRLGLYLTNPVLAVIVWAFRSSCAQHYTRGTSCDLVDASLLPVFRHSPLILTVHKYQHNAQQGSTPRNPPRHKNDSRPVGVGWDWLGDGRRQRADEMLGQLCVSASMLACLNSLTACRPALFRLSLLLVLPTTSKLHTTATSSGLPHPRYIPNADLMPSYAAPNSQIAGRSVYTAENGSL